MTLEPIRVLVADDDADIARGTARVLEKAGYTTATALSGEDTLLLLPTFRPHLVLLDLDMPGMDGLEVGRRIKADPAFAEVIVVLISGTYTRTEEQLTGLESGADGYLVRPISNRELTVRIETFIRILQLNHSLREKNVELARTAREWQTTFDATNDAIWILDADHRVMRTNKTAERFFQRSCQEMLGQHCWAVMHGTPEPHPDCPFVRARQTRQRESATMLVGGRWLEIVVDPIFDDAGQYAGAVHIVSDIHARKQAEEELVRRLAFEKLLADLQGELLAVDPEHLDDAIISAQRQLCHFLGTDRSALWQGSTEEPQRLRLTHLCTLDAIPPVPQDVTANSLFPWITAQLLAKQPVIVRDPGTLPAEAAVDRDNLIYYGDKGTVAIPLTLGEVPIFGALSFAATTQVRVWTEALLAQCKLIAQVFSSAMARKLSEQALREREAQLRLVTDHAPILLIQCDSERRYKFVNESYLKLLGRRREEVIGKHLRDVVGEAAYALVSPYLDTALAGQVAEYDQTLPLPVGPRALHARYAPEHDAAGRVIGVIAAIVDVTEYKTLEAQFLRAQRLDSLGALAGGIAHDLNNVLAPVLMAVPELRKEVGESSSRSMLDAMETSAQRGSDIIKQLLTFARGTPGARVSLPVRPIQKELVNIIQETFPRNIRAHVEAAYDLWPVLGDATQLHQALLNLCINARDALPEGGT
ncbi:MAG: PAS domain-containing protein, partial [Verrucomicrobiota bacterium]